MNGGAAGEGATDETAAGHGGLGERAELGIDGLSAVAMIGSGGSSTVYRARQDALDREVAVKVVHAAWTMETRERFEHERELMGRLSGHTDIVPIFETGITKRGEPYLLMPYYPRGSLFRLMRDRGPLPWAEAGFLIETVAATLADCHHEGIVHRDVKPGNVLLTRHLHPRLTDFGIALPREMATSPATVAYTPSYSPPEAFEPGVAAPTVDVYGLAATLWALLAGRPPHADVDRADPAACRDRALAGAPGPPTPDTPPPLAALLARSMDPEPRRRPPDAAAFLAEIRRAGRIGHRDQPIPLDLTAAPTPSAGGRSGGGAADVAPPSAAAGAADRTGLLLTLGLVAGGLALMAVGVVALLG
ncbi:MAG: serine/threonine-protein kinase [Actinomycetota bacterium]